MRSYLPIGNLCPRGNMSACMFSVNTSRIAQKLSAGALAPNGSAAHDAVAPALFRFVQALVRQAEKALGARVPAAALDGRHAYADGTRNHARRSTHRVALRDDAQALRE